MIFKCRAQDLGSEARRCRLPCIVSFSFFLTGTSTTSSTAKPLGSKQLGSPHALEARRTWEFPVESNNDDVLLTLFLRCAPSWQWENHRLCHRSLYVDSPTATEKLCYFWPKLRLRFKFRRSKQETVYLEKGTQQLDKTATLNKWEWYLRVNSKHVFDAICVMQYIFPGFTHCQPCPILLLLMPYICAFTAGSFCFPQQNQQKNFAEKL